MLSRRDAFAALAALLPGGSLPAGGAEGRDLVKLLADAVQHLRLTSPPVGSVQAFAGDWPPRKADDTTWTEVEIGWLLCDGRKLADVQAELHKQLEKQGKKVPEDGMLADLRAVLPQLSGGKPAEVLPDYRGVFLRGVDKGSDGKSTDRDSDGARVVGQEQKAATAMPTGDNKFRVNQSGGHKHIVENVEGDFDCLMRVRKDRDGYSRGVKGNAATHGDASHMEHMPPDGGQHTHPIAGGDKETRPVNVAVNYIVKFQ